jgi:hypothetical protein
VLEKTMDVGSPNGEALMTLNQLNIKQLKNRLVYYEFLIEDIEEITRETRDIDEIKKRYRDRIAEIRRLVDLRTEERKLKRGRDLLRWFGVVTVTIGVVFFVYDYEIWKYFNFGLIKRLYAFLIGLPGIAKFTLLSSAVGAMYWAAFRERRNTKKAYPLVVLALPILGYDLYMAPVWLLATEMYRSSLLITSLVVLVTSYQLRLKTLVYLGLFGLCNWFGGCTGYWTGCYWLYMRDPLIFVPFGAGLIFVAHLIGKYDKRDLKQPLEIVGILTLFLALLILSIWGYTFGAEDFFSDKADIAPVWFIIVMTLSCMLFIWLGIKWERKLFFNVGVTFLAIDLYTRFFEVFMDWLPRSLFWLILGGSVLLLSTYVRKKLLSIQRSFK